MRKPAFVLVHGWGLNEEVWNNLTEPLSKHYEVHPLALPGYGKRQGVEAPKSVDALADDLLSQAPERAIWCGWSLGGMAAIAAAVRQPERIQALHLLCVTPRFIREDGWDAGTDLPTFEAFAQNLVDDYQRGIQRFLLLQSGTSSDAKRVAKEASKALQKHPAPTSATLLSGLDILEDADLRPMLKELNTPCHVIGGRRDRVVHPDACAYLAREIPNANYTELNSGHAPHFSHTEELLEIFLSEYLTSVPAQIADIAEAKEAAE